MTSSAPAATPPTPSPSAQPSAPTVAKPITSGTPTNERRWEARKNGVIVLTVSNKPGFIVDGNAPPPAPGQSPTKHPFLSATCLHRDPMVCSQLGQILDASRSLEEFLSKLAADGFQVGELHPGDF